MSVFMRERERERGEGGGGRGERERERERGRGRGREGGRGNKRRERETFSWCLSIHCSHCCPYIQSCPWCSIKHWENSEHNTTLGRYIHTKGGMLYVLNRNEKSGKEEVGTIYIHT